MESKEEVKCSGEAMSLPANLSCLQGAEGEAALATLEKQLICPICLELFNKPVVILPCQHNLCRKCANKLYQPSLFQARTTMQVNSGRFLCPSCRHEVVLDRHGVYGLPRNLLVENIIDVYKQEVSNNSNATCPRPLPPPSAQLTCSDHEGEKVNIYCLTCQRPTCSLCKVFGAHHACQVAPLTDIWHQQKDELSEAVSSLAAVNNKVQTLINELEETCRNVEENCKTQKQSVCETFSRVFSILEERQKAMMQRISTEQEEKTGHAQELMRCYGDSVEANSKLVERAVSCMEEPDMAAFVQNSKELITEVIAASSSCPAEALKPGCESLSHYRFDFSRQEKALKSIDFLKVVEEVPEEAEVEPEPEEPKEDSVQNVEPEQHQETSAQNLDPGVEAIPELVSPPEELTAVTLPVSYTVEPAVALLQPETDNLDVADGGSVLLNRGVGLGVEMGLSTPKAAGMNSCGCREGPIENACLQGPEFCAAPLLMKKEEAEKEEGEKVEPEGHAAPEPVKEGNICEEQEGMSTVQAVTLLFYLLAFLVILQRVWAYIGCFICT
ncbi:tripartite motif-containing protein 54 isoform X2 [Etheostoma spectabile]|uniref:tripartite motif-containing protein 54 isoform X2 n=1 Tax=Etheostoma spectabile TaxID=54343 RepID=UPI0013AF1036|nr:tripartite motif-containing protein 54-like isoform X2 [Etheostoma spectabile]